MKNPSHFPARRPSASAWLALLLLANVLLPSGVARAASPTPTPASSVPEPWVSTWAAAQSNPDTDVFFAANYYAGTNAFNNQTVRLIVHISLGGKQVRVRLTNEQGTQPVLIGAAHVALNTNPSAADIDPATDHVLTFGGVTSVTIPPGAPILSDPVKFPVADGANLAISLFLPDATIVNSGHPYAIQSNFVAPPGTGDTTSAASLPLDPTYPLINQWPLLGGVEVRAKGANVIVAFGSSVTAGFDTTMDANARWPDLLAARLSRHGRATAVINTSITANRLINDRQGPNQLSRFDRDVLARPGTKFVVLCDAAGVEISGGQATADEIITALKQLVRRAHTYGIKAIGTTVLPVYNFPGYSVDNEAKRQTVNAFIRTSPLFDGMVDFDAVIRDPNMPVAINPLYDSGDHHHPNDAGHAAMAAAIPLSLFK